LPCDNAGAGSNAIASVAKAAKVAGRPCIIFMDV
jgi:hypothetical protein